MRSFPSYRQAALLVVSSAVLLLLTIVHGMHGSAALAAGTAQQHVVISDVYAGDVAKAFAMEGTAGYIGGRAKDAVHAMFADKVSGWFTESVSETAAARGMVNERGEVDIKRVFEQCPELKDAVRANIKEKLAAWLPGAVRDLVKDQVFGRALGQELTAEIESMLDRVVESFDATFNAQIDAYIEKWYGSGVERVREMLEKNPATAWIDPAQLRESVRAALSSTTIMGATSAAIGQVLGDSVVDGIHDHLVTMLGGELPPEVMRLLEMGPLEFEKLKGKLEQYLPGNVIDRLTGSVLNKPLFKMHSGAYGAILAANAARHYAAAYKGMFIDADELRRAIQITRVMVWQLKEKKYVNVSLMNLAPLGKSFAAAIGAESLYGASLANLTRPLDKLGELTDKLDRLLMKPIDRLGTELRRAVDEVTGKLTEIQDYLAKPLRDAIGEFDGVLNSLSGAVTNVLPDGFDGLPASWAELKQKAGVDGVLGEWGEMTPRRLMDRLAVMDDVALIGEDLRRLNERMAEAGAAAAAEILEGVHLLGPASVILGVEEVPARHPSDANALDPVLLHNGEFVHQVTDMVLPGRGIDLRFTRIYRSRSDFVGPLGYNWTHSYAERLLPWKREDGAGSIYVDDAGMKHFFEEKTDGGYVSPKGLARELARTEEGFVMRDPQGNETHFHHAGLLREKRDPHGNRLRFIYNDRAQLVAIVDTMSRPFVLRYNEDGFIAEIEDIAGRIWTYEYDDEQNLAAARSPVTAHYVRGKKTAYLYSNAYDDPQLNHNLIAIMDPKGQLYLRNRYGIGGIEYDRVIEQRYGERTQRLRVAYANVRATCDDPNAIASRAWVTDRRGVVHVYEHNTGGQVLTQWIVPTVWEPKLVMRHRYDEEGRRVKSCRPLGRCTAFSYAKDGALAHNDIIEMQELPSDDAEPRVTRIAYDRRFHKPSEIIDAKGYRWEFAYDEKGALTQLLKPMKGARWGEGWSYEYNSFGQLTSVRDGQGVITAYEYYAERDPDGDGLEMDGADALNDTTGGYLKRIIRDAVDYTHRFAHGAAAKAATQFIYDDAGNIVKLTDAGGATTHFKVNTLNQITKEILPDESIRSYRFDANDNLVRVEIVRGEESVVRSFKYGPLDRLAVARAYAKPDEPIETRYGYDPAGELVRVTMPEGNEVRITRDAYGRVVCEERGDERECREYDADGDTIAMRDGLNAATTIARNGFGEWTRIVDPRGTTRAVERDARGRIVEQNIVDAKGALLAHDTFTYNGRDELIARGRLMWRDDPRDADLVLWRFVHDFHGNVLEEVDPLGRVRAFAYDGLGLLARAEDPLGNAMMWERDGRGSVTARILDEKLESGERRKTRHVYTYDAVGNLSTATDPAGATTSYAYGVLGGGTSRIDALGNVTRHVRDGLGRITKVERRAAQDEPVIATVYAWDGNNRLAGIVDARGNETRFSYDAADRLTKTMYPDRSAERRAYDAAGRLAKLTDRAGNAFVQHFDASGDVVRRTIDRAEGFSGTSRQRFAYDGMGRLISAIDENDPGDAHDDMRIDRYYDSLGNVFAERIGEQWVSSSFDAVGNRIAMRYPSGRTIGYTYDAASRIVRTCEGERMIVERVYDGINQVRLSHGDGTVEAMRWDVRGMLSTWELTRADGSVLDALAYTYDAAGYVTDERRRVLGVTSTYHYDGLGRLTAADLGGRRLTYALDGAGNWRQTTDGVAKVEWDVDTMNAYRTARGEGGTIRFAYDAGGNLAFDGTRRYRYDALGRLIETAHDGQADERRRYIYDALGRLVRMYAGEETTDIMFAGWQEVGMYGDSTAEFVNGSRLDDRLAVYRGDELYHFHHDRLGSIIEVTGGWGKVDGAYRYDPYGKRYAIAPWGDEEAASDPDALAFTGRPQDPSGLVQMRLRSYHPLLGRFTTPDPAGYKNSFHVQTAGAVPLVGSYHAGYGAASQATLPNRSLDIGGGPVEPYPFKRWFPTPSAFSQAEPNLYLYAKGNPLSYTDPYGLASLLFDRSDGTLTLFYRDGRLIIQEHAANNTVRPKGDPLAIGSHGPAPNGTFDISPPEFRTREIREDFYAVWSPDEYAFGESTVTGYAWVGSYNDDHTYNISQGNIRFRIGDGGSALGTTERIMWDRHIFLHGGRNGRETSRTYGCLRGRDAELEALAYAFIALYRSNDPVTTITLRD